MTNDYTPAEVVGLLLECPSCGARVAVRVTMRGCGGVGTQAVSQCRCGIEIVGGYTSTGLAFGRIFHRSSERTSP